MGRPLLKCLAWVGRLCLWTAGVAPAATCRCAALAETPTFEFDAQRRLDAVLTGSGQVRCRLRNQFNQVLYESDYDGRQLALPDLAPGSYFCDFLVRQGEQTVSFGYYEFAVASPVGKVDLAVPEVHELQAAINGRLTLEKPFAQPLQVRVELMDSPYYRVWHRREFTLAAGQTALDWQLPASTCPPSPPSSAARWWTRLPTIAKSVQPKQRFSFQITVGRLYPNGVEQYRREHRPMTAPVLADRLGWTLACRIPRPVAVMPGRALSTSALYLT